MGHYCRICGRDRPNEKFSGRGHRIHVCKDCSQKPKSEINRILIKKELWDYINQQSNISKKNIARLKNLMQAADEEIRELSGIVFKVAQAAPRKRNRFQNLAKIDERLLEKLKDSALVSGESDDSEPCDSPDGRKFFFASPRLDTLGQNREHHILWVDASVIDKYRGDE